MDCNAVSIKSLGLYFGVNSELFSRQYKNKLSDYRSWDQYAHACDYLVFPQNMGKFLSIDETSLSNGELYTILTNKSASGKKGTIIGIFRGVEAYSIISRIREHIPKKLLRQVEEITLDLSPTMNAITKSCFANAKRVADRFHVQRLVYDMVQQIRIEYRWEAIEQESDKIKHARETDSEYNPEILNNGESPKQLLARTRYLLFKSPSALTSSQAERANILFHIYPRIEQAYDLSMELKEAYNHHCQKEVSWLKLAHGAEKVRHRTFKSFNTIVNTFFNYYDNIPNYYNNISTNECY